MFARPASVSGVDEPSEAFLSLRFRLRRIKNHAPRAMASSARATPTPIPALSAGPKLFLDDPDPSEYPDVPDVPDNPDVGNVVDVDDGTVLARDPVAMGRAPEAA